MKIFFLLSILTYEVCCASSEQLNQNQMYNEEKVQLILQNYEHYSLESFANKVQQCSSFVPENTNKNNQEALRRKRIDDELIKGYNKLNIASSSEQKEV